MGKTGRYQEMDLYLQRAGHLSGPRSRYTQGSFHTKRGAITGLCMDGVVAKIPAYSVIILRFKNRSATLRLEGCHCIPMDQKLLTNVNPF